MIRGLVSRHSITRTRPTKTPNAREGFDLTWPNTPDTKTIHGWAADAGNTVEDLRNREGTEITWTLRGPFDADVERNDKITLFGEDYSIEGEPRRQPGPTPLTSHTILQLARWKG